MPGTTVIIKKYGNRRLYDSSNSRYVNLEDIAQMVRQGTNIRVVDAVTGEDLTRLVLTQIIVESAKVPDSPFPIDMLRDMIIASGRLSQEGMRAYMNTMLDFYQNTYRAFAPGFAPFAGVRRANAEAPSSSPGAHAGKTSEAEASPVEELRRRIEDLERRLAKNPGRAAPAKRNRRTRPKNK
jgi:polyhydroxyalkanoate synthesis repressor PhaR